MIAPTEIEIHAMELAADIDLDDLYRVRRITVETHITLLEVLGRIADLAWDLSDEDFNAVWRRSVEINPNIQIVEAFIALRRKRSLS
jgi:hypothetical protein